MHQAPIVQSTEVRSEAVGARAARHLDLVFRTLTNGARIEKNDNFIRVMTGEPHPMGNLAIVRNSNDPDVSGAAVQPLIDSNLPACVLYPDEVADAVAEMVVGYGFEPTSMPAMVVEIERMTATSLPPGYAFERIGARDGAAWTDAFANGYKLPAGLARIFSPELLGADMADDASTQFFAIRSHRRLVATSLLHLADGLAGIYCVATLPDERGKGLGAHATAAALREAYELGYRVGILQSSPDGHPVYLRLGFEDRATVPMFVRMPN